MFKQNHSNDINIHSSQVRPRWEGQGVGTRLFFSVVKATIFQPADLCSGCFGVAMIAFISGGFINVVEPLEYCFSLVYFCVCLAWCCKLARD